MRRLRCPRCQAVVSAPEGRRPVCGSCGLGGRARNVRRGYAMAAGTLVAVASVVAALFVLWPAPDAPQVDDVGDLVPLRSVPMPEPEELDPRVTENEALPCEARIRVWSVEDRNATVRVAEAVHDLVLRARQHVDLPAVPCGFDLAVEGPLALWRVASEDCAGERRITIELLRSGPRLTDVCGADWACRDTMRVLVSWQDAERTVSFRQGGRVLDVHMDGDGEASLPPRCQEPGLMALVMEEDGILRSRSVELPACLGEAVVRVEFVEAEAPDVFAECG